MKKVLLDGNIYDKLARDTHARDLLSQLITALRVEVIATPVVVDELKKSPFGGLPTWFPVTVLPEEVFVIGYAHLGMARLSDGEVYSQHRGNSQKAPDAIIAHSADALAHLLVSEDQRCRKRLATISTRCRAVPYEEFCEWLGTEARFGDE